MRIDNETGNIEYINYETYEAMKEEYENKIEELEQKNEDLEYNVEQVEKQLREATDDVEFLLDVIHQHLKLTDLVLKKRFNHCND